METVITRDSDIIREYLAALDARERGLSPFARLAATVKLARLRYELHTTQLETTDEDIAALRREIDERLNRNFVRRFESKSWGARISIFLMMVFGQQLVLALVLLATMLFVQLAPRPVWLNSVFPYEEPIFLWVFIFFFLFTTPMLALVVLFGGRYFGSWRKTLPATFIILALAILGTYFVRLNKPNPIEMRSSLSHLVEDKDMMDLNVKAYRDWVDSNWLLKDPKFQHDYEVFLRNGPGRWITSRFDAKDDSAWRNSLPVMLEYIDGGQDPNSFREWLKYYLDRNRIYSEDRVEQEVNAITSEANQKHLGIWQVEPYLKERDQRMYRAYLGSINKSMKVWGLYYLALFALIFLLIYFTGPMLSFWERTSMRVRVRRRNPAAFDPDRHDLRDEAEGRASRLKERYYSFPEQDEIATPPFFDTPFKLLSRVHRSFVRLAVFTALFVFGFWALVYIADLAAGNENAPSQVALMRSHLLFGGRPDSGMYSANNLLPDDLITKVSADAPQQNSGSASAANSSYAIGSGPYYGLGYSQTGAPLSETPPRREALLALRVAELERRLEDADYDYTKKLKEQAGVIESQRNQINLLKDLTGQLQQSTSPVAGQLAELSSRATAAEARAGEVLGEVGTAKQKAENVEKQLTAKLSEVENRAARAADQVGKVEDQTSLLATRTEALEKELDRRARQVEARTEELGERTAALREREERLARLQRIALTGIASSIKADVDDLDRRTQSTLYRLFNKGQARREADSLKERIARLLTDMREMNADQTKEIIEQLDELNNRLNQINERIK